MTDWPLLLRTCDRLLVEYVILPQERDTYYDLYPNVMKASR